MIPVAVPGICLRCSNTLAFADRSHSLGSFYPPLAAVASFPLRQKSEIFATSLVRGRLAKVRAEQFDNPEFFNVNKNRTSVEVLFFGNCN